jgi:integrase
MEKRHLTDRTLKGLKPAAAGKHYDRMDSTVPGLGVRVSDTGRRTFILIARFPGTDNPTRRALGEYGALTLEKARAKGREWRELIAKGIDPRDHEDRQREAEQKKRENTFAAVFEDFKAAKLATERKGAEVERDIRRECFPAFGACPVSEISDEDVLAVIEAKARTAPAQARNLLGHAKRLFAWAAAPGRRKRYGLAGDPCSAIRPKDHLPDKRTGDRTLSDDELFALWRATERMPYPYGAVYQLLLLTALRLNEVADASWPEFQLRDGIWVISAARMKGKNGKAVAHAVPLTAEILAILSDLPRFNGGQFLFSTTFGQKPAWISNKIKKGLDRRMMRTLKALARKRGDKEPTFEPWSNHDIRRTVRTRLSRLKIVEEVREAMLAHVRPGIKKNYDLHDYLDEKREALTLWAARLREIVEPTPSNVVKIERARGGR